MNHELTPTPEQDAALEAYASGENLVIEAGAGSGKTSTLVLLARSTPDRRGQYIAFNKAIVEDSRARMPGHVSASTAHSLAFRALGHRYSHRLNQGQRMRSWELARLMRMQPIRIGDGEAAKFLEDHFLASLVMDGITTFCQSADEAPFARRHIGYIEGIDQPDKDGRRTYANNNMVQAALQKYMDIVWSDLQGVNGAFQFKHEHYLKMWQLSGPRIGADVIYFDEAQDVSPVLAAIIEAQTHAQLVYVGDPNQSIYGFTGAVDAMSKLDSTRRTTLSQSFRFGQAVADVANEVLSTLPTELRLTGYDQIQSVVGPVAEPDAVLCRTNAVAVENLLDALDAGVPAHMVGGGREVVAFARGSQDLRTRGKSSHPDLACFKTWGEVQDYVDRDRQGEELRLMVALVDRFGADVIIDAVQNMAREEDADLVISTAHKAKGREWGSVKLAGDFPSERPDDGDDEGEGAKVSLEERRLLYVAVTRARVELDAGAVPWVCEAEAPAAGQDELPGMDGSEAAAA